jgi:hypothetical protein
MAIIVEDGTGLAAAESYCTVAFANTYFKNRGIALWEDLETTRKEQLLRIATDYIDMRFGARFRASPLTRWQALCFPRGDSGPLPVVLQRATAEYAMRAVDGPLVADPVTDERGLQVRSKTEKLGPLEERVEYVDSGASVFKPYPAADMLLKSLLRPTGIIR